MKRDLALIRDLLLRIEATPANRDARLDTTEVDEDVVHEHLEMLIDAGLIEGTVLAAGSGHARIYDVRVKRLTWTGHEFLANAQNEGAWAKTLEFVRSKGGAVSLEIVKELLKRAVLDQFGLSRPG